MSTGTHGGTVVDTRKEVWIDIEGGPGYQISNYGRVKSVERIIKRGTNFLPIRGRILKPWKRSKDYLSVGFQVDGKRKVVLVHRLVANAFIPNRESGMEINHLDGDKTNNTVENLEWVTTSENVLHAYATGLKKATHSKKVKVEMFDGTTLDFSSMKDCSEYFGFGRGWVRYRASRLGNPFTYEGNKFQVICKGDQL